MMNVSFLSCTPLQAQGLQRYHMGASHGWKHFPCAHMYTFIPASQMCPDADMFNEMHILSEDIAKFMLHVVANSELPTEF